MIRSFAIAALAAAAAFASMADAEGAAQQTQATIRVFEQAGGFVADEMLREYTTRFDAVRTRTLFVEITLAHPPAATTQLVAVSCEMTTPDGRRIPGVFKIGVNVRAGETQSVAANTQWPAPAGGAWVPGTYVIRCNGGGLKFDETRIEMVMNPPDVADTDIRVARIRFFHVGKEVPPLEQREYRGWSSPSNFELAKTQRIGIELEFRHAPLPRAVSVPVDCFMYLPDGTPSPDIPFTYDAPAGQRDGQAARAIGFDDPGHWPTGKYSAICRINGHPVAFDRFRVQ